MKAWVKQILKPYMFSKPDGIVSILLLDMYKCHMMESVVSTITQLGVEVLHIPVGCMGLCQPVDVGINKSLKSEVQKLWEGWMVKLCLNDGVNVPPTWLDVAEWVIEVYYLPEQIVLNAWKKGYAWFTYREKVEDRNGGVHIGDDAFFHNDANVDSDIDLNVFEGEV